MTKRNRTKRNQKINIRKILIVLAMMICTLVLGYCIRNFLLVKDDMDKVIEMQEETKMQTEPEEDPWAYMEEFRRMKEKNPDFMGWIKFDSGLINLPFMYSGDDLYLRADFEKKYSSSGTVYMDGKQTLDGQNITLYGHYVYANDKAMFSPLDKLRKEENYEENKVFRLYLENEIRTYTVATVVEYTLGNHWNFDLGYYTKEQFDEFLNYGSSHSLYPIDEIMDAASNYVTLQTCIRGTDTRRTIVVGKEKNRVMR